MKRLSFKTEGEPASSIVAVECSVVEPESSSDAQSSAEGIETIVGFDAHAESALWLAVGAVVSAQTFLPCRT